MHKLDQYLSGSLLAFKKIDVFKAGSSAKQSRIWFEYENSNVGGKGG